MANLMSKIHKEGEYSVCFVCCKGHHGFDLHHIKRRSQGGKHTIDNLGTICHYCHMMFHSSPDQFRKLYGESKYNFLRGKHE